MTESIRPPLMAAGSRGCAPLCARGANAGLRWGTECSCSAMTWVRLDGRRDVAERADRMQIPAIAFFGMLLESLDFGRLDHTLSTGLPPPSQTRRSALTERECRTQSRLAGGQRLSSERR